MLKFLLRYIVLILLIVAILLGLIVFFSINNIDFNPKIEKTIKKKVVFDTDDLWGKDDSDNSYIDHEDKRENILVKWWKFFWSK